MKDDMNTSLVLHVHDLSVALPKHADRPFAVEDMEIKVHAGEIVCVVGESGSGKSVTAFTVMGLHDKRALTPVKGEILLEGIEGHGPVFPDLLQ